MPWSYPDNIPTVAQNWTADEQRRCVSAANEALDGGTEEEAIRACIGAAGKARIPPGRKSFTVPLMLKEDAPEGSVLAVVSVFDVEDRDGDVVRESAFEDGQELPMCAQHDMARITGKGIIRKLSDRALFEGRFFLDTIAGQEAYRTVKNLGRLAQWSWSFAINRSERGKLNDRDVRFILDTERFEVSHVLVGANQHTETLSIKSFDWSRPMSLAGHGEHARTGVQSWLDRVESLADLRAKEGQTISGATDSELEAMEEALAASLDRVRALRALRRRREEPAGDEAPPDAKAHEHGALLLDLYRIAAELTA